MRTGLLQMLHNPAAALRAYRLRPRRRFGVWLGRAAIVACAWFAATSISSGLSDPAQADWDGWRPATPGDGQVLRDAVAVGQEDGMMLYPCRGALNGKVHVGRFRRDFGGCHVGYAGRETEVALFEVLAASWKPGGGDIPANSLGAGEEMAANPGVHFDLARLYPCRAAYQGGIHSGQAKAGKRGCSFGFGGKQVVVSAYDVLQLAPWMTWAGGTPRDLPDDMIASGSEGGEPFFVCRASDRNGLHSGKIKRSALGCSIVSEDREATVERFEVLVARWSPANEGVFPVSAFPAGREGGNNQFVCRAQSRDTMQIGKVDEELGGCHVGMQGVEVILKNYEVLAQ